MKERDPFPFGADSRLFVNKPDARRPAARQDRIEIGNREAYVVNSRSTSGDEFSNRSIRLSRLEKLDK